MKILLKNISNTDVLLVGLLCSLVKYCSKRHWNEYKISCSAAGIYKNTSIFLIFDIEIIFNLNKFIWGALEYKFGTVDRGLHPAIYK